MTWNTENRCGFPYQGELDYIGQQPNGEETDCMLAFRKMKSHLAALGMFVLSVVASGCATGPELSEIEVPVAVAIVEPEVEQPQVPIVNEPQTAAVVIPPPPKALPPVAVVMSSRNPAYESVVTELDKHFETYSVYDFSDKSQPPVTAFRTINDQQVAAVVAIGLRAAKSAIAMSKSPVIFSQIFNYQDHGLVTANSRGISAIAPLDAQLGAWKTLDPMISEVGLIIGEGHDQIIADARDAAERAGIKLNVRVSRSDQETLYFYKRMIADIDGFWMMPDNRILSGRVIRELLDDARRRNVAVVVSNDAMLSIGAAISFTASPSNVAERIVEVLRHIQSGSLADVPDITPLTDMNIATNNAVLEKRVVVGKVNAEQDRR